MFLISDDKKFKISFFCGIMAVLNPILNIILSSIPFLDSIQILFSAFLLFTPVYSIISLIFASKCNTPDDNKKAKLLKIAKICAWIPIIIFIYWIREALTNYSAHLLFGEKHGPGCD